MGTGSVSEVGTYPLVAGEFHTMCMVSRGYSLARFGDGEMKMAEGFGYSREPGSPKLANELLKTLRTPHARCLVGIPTYDPAGPKYENWLRHKDRFRTLLQPGVPYFSAFVSRPDSAPWINTKEYAELVQSIWAGKSVAVICEKTGSMLPTIKLAAARVKHFVCPREKAYARIDKLQESVTIWNPDIVVMAAGPTATCLANRFAGQHIQAVDLGSAGGFLGRLLRS